MGTALQTINHNDRLSTVQRVGNILTASGYFSDLRDVAQAAVKVMAGEELGIAPVASVMGIHIIKGKVALSANLIAAQVRRHGYNYIAKFEANGCTITFVGKSGEMLGDSSFTEADAKLAGVFSEMYKKFPRNMYFSRAMSNGAKWYTPEVMSGMPIYTPEELGAKVDSDGEVIHGTQAQAEPEPRGSKEAAQAVAAEKIERMKAQAQKQDEALHVGPHDAQFVEPPATELEEQLTESIENAKEKAAEAERKKLYYKDLGKVGELKKKMAEVTGDDVLYYRVISDNGYSHANEIPASQMVPIYKILAAAFKAWKGDQPMPEAI